MDSQALGVPNSTAAVLGVGDSVVDVQYSPDGRWLAAVNGMMIILIDAITLQQRAVLIQDDVNFPSHIRSITFSPNSKLLVSVSEARRLAFWDVQAAARCPAFLHDGEPLDQFTPMGFSPDGRLLALFRTGSPPYEILIWDMVRQMIQTTIRLDGDIFLPIEFNRDGTVLAVFVRNIASGEEEQNLTLWNTHTGRHLATSRVNGVSVQSATFRPDGKVLVGIVNDIGMNILTSWDGHTGVQLGIHEEEIQLIAYSPDGEICAKARRNGTIELRKVANPFDGPENGELLHTLKTIGLLLFSPDSNFLAVNGNDEIEIWDIQRGALHRTFPREDFSAVAFSPDSRTFIVAEVNKGLLSWNVEDGTSNALIPIGSGDALSFSRDGGTIILAQPRSQDIALTRWNAGTGRQKNTREVTLDAPAYQTTSKVLSSHGQFMALGQHGSLSVWNTATGDRLRIWREPQISYGSMVFSPDNRFLATTHYNSTSQAHSIAVWEIAGGVKYRQFQSPLSATLAFSPDGDTLAVGDGNSLRAEGTAGTIVLWNVHTGDITRVLSGHEPTVRSLAFSPDGRTLASGGGLRVLPAGFDSTVRLWDVSTGEERHVLTEHRGVIETLRFSPDGRLLASGSNDRTVKLWLVPEGKELYTFGGRSESPEFLAFSPDGGRLAIAASDVLVWNLAELFDTFPPTTAEMQTVPLVSQSALLPNFPNPFNPETWLPYILHRDADVQISVYDVQGNSVRFLEFGHRVAGSYDRHCNAAYWDGRNDAGEQVTSGIYFYTLQAGGFRATRKMVLTR